MPYAATLDANVLHPQITMDLLLRLGDRGLYRMSWSRAILDEAYDSLVRRGLDAKRIRQRFDVMEREFPEAMSEQIEAFLPSVPPDVHPKDRHVVAAALAAKADAIVTNDLGGFPTDSLNSLGLEVQTLDGFLLNQWTLDAETVKQVLAEMEEDRDRPPQTIPALLDALAQHAPEFATIVRQELFA
jgi:predicted nucleic acid-binding protein